MNSSKKSARRMQLDELRLGDTAAFFPAPGEERAIYQTPNDSWVKLEGKAFTLKTGLLVSGSNVEDCVKTILVTRVQ